MYQLPALHNFLSCIKKQYGEREKFVTTNKHLPTPLKQILAMAGVLLQTLRLCPRDT